MMMSYLQAVLTLFCLLLVDSVLSCGRCSKGYYSEPHDTGTCYGDVDDLKPRGQLDDGVQGSELSVLADWEDLSRMRDCYEKVAYYYCIQVSLVAAIASRESRGGRALNETGYSEDGKAYGIMQCPFESSTKNCLACDWDSCCHVRMMMGEFLVFYLTEAEALYNYKRWPKSRILQDGLVAYDMKALQFRWKKRIDRHTTNGDYSNDVLARAQYLKRNGWEQLPFKKNTWEYDRLEGVVGAW